MAKAKKKNKKGNDRRAYFIRFALLVVFIVVTTVLVYEHFRPRVLPVLVPAQTAISDKIDTAIKKVTKESKTAIEKVNKTLNQTTKNSNKQRTPQLHIDRAEVPAPLTDRNERILAYSGHTLSYNSSYRIPNWVAWELLISEVGGKIERMKFMEDPNISAPKAVDKDYVQSGYDRGHMAPAADMKWSELAMQECFYFSNICPQAHQLNAGLWKVIEEGMRKQVDKDSALLIVCGPIVEKPYKTIGKNKVVVPTAFFKAIVAPYANPPRGIGFVFKNDDTKATLNTYVVTIDEIERRTGIDLFPALPDTIENSVEANSNFSEWTFGRKQ